MNVQAARYHYRRLRKQYLGKCQSTSLAELMAAEADWLLAGLEHMAKAAKREQADVKRALEAAQAQNAELRKGIDALLRDDSMRRTAYTPPIAIARADDIGGSDVPDKKGRQR